MSKEYIVHVDIHVHVMVHVYTFNNSLNCSSVVSASLGCVSTDPSSGSAVPPNTVTSVSPGPRLKPVRECAQRGFRAALT